MSSSVNVTQLRQNLGEYLKQIRVGKEVEVTMHGKVIARLVPEAAKSIRAKKRLAELRKTARVGDCATRPGEAHTTCLTMGLTRFPAGVSWCGIRVMGACTDIVGPSLGACSRKRSCV